MNTPNYILVLVLMACLSSCKEGVTTKRANELAEKETTQLQVDHFNVWVENPNKAKEQLTAIGFTSVPDSLSQVHHGQGTAGRYFYFLNGYLELIFVHDRIELERNSQKNSGLDFLERADFKNNGASPFGLALKLKDYQPEEIPFEKVRYHQDWMEEGVSIYSAKNSKTHLKEPSIFVVYPEIESDRFETLADLKNIPEEHGIWREFFRHSNGAKKLTKIVLTSVEVDLNTETMEAVNGMETMTVKNGAEHLMELYFDHQVQGQSFDLRPELPLIIYL